MAEPFRTFGGTGLGGQGRTALEGLDSFGDVGMTSRATSTARGGGAGFGWDVPRGV